MRRLFARHAIDTDLSAAALTPMVDLFTILVIAVLRASSPEPPQKPLESAFEFPISRSETQTQKAAELEIGVDGIALEGIRVGSTVYWSKHEAALITDLKGALLILGPNRLQIKAHKDAPWTVVNKAMYTAQQSGIKNVEIIALSASSL